MPKFRIIPVLDILNSRAVHAVKGERDNYRPLKSKILKTSDPLKIVEVLTHSFDFEEIYIADLDAIINKKPNHEILLKILKTPKLKVMLDPGIINEDNCLTYSKLRLNKLILGIETIENLEIIKEGIRLMGQNRLTISIDMYNGNIISKLKELKNLNPLQLLKLLSKLEVKEIILLDLFRVGQKIGGIPPLYMKFRSQFKGDILIGGGVKEFNDLEMMVNNGFSGALIATALYDGSLNINNLKNFN